MILEMAQLLRRRQLTSVDLVRSCYESIEQREAHIHAWVQLDQDRALAAAEQLDREATKGQWCGVLHGIPIGVKDIIDVAGLPTRAGSPLRADHVAKADADIVATLRSHGAVVLGKTVTTQFACFDPAETVNPRNATLTPGGSSSGSAAALASDMCLGALGTQTGGSIIRPATYCGVCGLKPTIGSWSTRGVVPVSAHLDHVGPMGRRVSDLVCQWRFEQTTEEVASFIDDAARRTAFTFGVPDDFRADAISDDVAREFDRALALMAAAGATFQTTKLPTAFAEVLAMHRRIMAFEAAQYHRKSITARPDAYAPNITSLIQEGLAKSAEKYAEALDHRRQFIADVSRQFGPDTIWLMPATSTLPPAPTSTGSPAFNSPWSYCGFPAVSLPIPCNDSELLCGLQLVAAPHNETTALKAALWCEQVVQSTPCPRGQAVENSGYEEDTHAKALRGKDAKKKVK